MSVMTIYARPITTGNYRKQQQQQKNKQTNSWREDTPREGGVGDIKVY